MTRRSKRNPFATAAVLVALVAMTAFAIVGCAAQPSATAPLEKTGTSAPEAALSGRIVTIDINPSVELEVGADGIVLDARPLNDDAKKVLDALKLEGLAATDAVKLIVAAAVSLGYIDPAATDTYVAISVEQAGNEPTDEEQGLEEELKASAEEGLDESGAEGQVDVSAITHERIAAARSLGLSPGRLNLIDRLAAALGQTREQVLATYGEAKVKEIMKALNAARPEGDESVDEDQGDESVDENGDPEDETVDADSDEGSDDQDEDVDEDDGDRDEGDAGQGGDEGYDAGKHNGEKNHGEDGATADPTPVVTIPA